MTLLFRNSITLLIFCLISISSISVYAQDCSISGSVNITDNDTSYISLIVDDLVNDDLSDPGQGICAVVMSFTHQAIADLDVRLISPSGQSVLLMGPSVATSPTTAFTSWENIAFVPCTNPPSPAAGTSPQWNNLDNWGLFFQYANVSYHPNLGCLEDFDTGSANGVWTLELVDGALFDDGVIIDFEIFFCDRNGLECNDCQADGGVLPIGDVTACQESPDLANVIPPVYPGGDAPDASFYDYSYVVSSADTITSYLDQSDFTNLDAGQYTVCGMSYLLDQLAPLPDVGVSVDSFNSILSLSYFCGDISDNCFDLEIIPKPDTILVNETICLGDSLLFRSEFYKVEGVFDFIDSVGLCEQVTRLDLEVRQVQAIIDDNIPLLSCNQDTLILNGTGSITGGNGTFSWSTTNGNIISTISTDSILVGSVGNYILSLEEDGCISTDTIRVSADNSIPTAQFIFNEINCNFDSSSIDASFNRTILSYKWLFNGDSIAMTEDIRVGDSGVYMIEVVADNGCEATYSVEVIENFTTANPTISAIDIDCNNPAIDIEVTNTTNGIHNWFFNDIFYSNQVSPQVVEPGDYKLIITESSGCLDSFFITVGIDTITPSTDLVVPLITCADPQITILATSNTPADFSFSGPGILSQDATQALIDQPGIYTASVLGDNGCINDTTFTVFPDNNFPVFEVFDGFIDCGQDSIQLVNNVMTSGVNFTWTGPGTYSSADAAPFVFSAGTYFVVGETNNGCAVFDTIEVELNPSIPIISFDRDTLDCLQDMVTITPNITANLLFDWSGPNITASTPSITVDSAAIYRVTVTDAADANCTARFSVNVVGDFAAPSFSFAADQLDCDTDSVTIDISLQDMVTNIEWSSDMGFLSDEEDLVVYATGDYFLDLTGINGCTSRDTITIASSTQSPDITITPVEINCIDFMPELEAISPDNIVSYSWSSPQNNFTSSMPSPTINEPGKYYLEVIADNGCTEIDSITVGIDTIAPIVNVAGNLMISCLDPETELTLNSNDPSANYNWLLNDGSLSGSQSLSVNSEGFYTYVVISANDCERRDSVFVDNINTEAVGDLSASEINCYNSNSIVNVTGIQVTTDIVWTSPSGIIETNASYTTTELGYHNVELTTTAGCVTLDSIEVIEDLIDPVLPVLPDSTLDCNLTTIPYSINISSSLDSVIWSRDGLFFSRDQAVDITSPGSYSYIVWADNGCTDSGQIDIAIDTLNPSAQIVGGAVSCNESKLLLQTALSSNVSSYIWSGPNNFTSNELEPTVKDPGIYTLYLEGNNGCIDSATVEVINDLIPPDVEQVDQFLPCNTDPITLSIPGNTSGVDISWFGPGNFFSSDPTPSVNIPGEYFVFATGDNGCIGRDTFMVLDTPIPPIFDALDVLLDCNNPSQALVALDAGDDQLIEWFDPAGNLLVGESPLVDNGGTYDLVVTGNNFCKDTLEVIVSIDTIAPMAMIVNDDFLLCDQTSYNITALGSSPASLIDYSWSTIDGTILSNINTEEITVGATGTYELMVTNQQNGCTDIASTLVTNGIEGTISYDVEAFSPSCLGLSDGILDINNVAGGFAPYSFSVNGGSVQSDSILTNLSAGIYTLTVYDRFGCTEQEQVIITEGTDIMLDLGADLEIMLGDSVKLQAITNADFSTLDTTVWTSFIADSICDFCLDPTIIPLESGFVSLTLIDMNGCEETDEVYIAVDETRDVYIPNIFSPNGDNNNDQLILGASDGLRIINSFKIFDNWGNKVYQLEDFHPDMVQEGWDGTFKNEELNPAVFTYMIELTLINGDQIYDSGSITLIR